MKTIRVVRDGEHLDVIAYRHGVEPSAVWEAAANAELRETRVGGHMLKAGDVVVLPARVHPKPVSISGGDDLSIVARIPKVPVEVVLMADGKPLAGEPWRVEGRGESARGTTGADGKVTFEVRVTTPRVALLLERAGQRRELSVGALDPDHSVRGVAQRLRNLGFYDGEPVGTMTPPLWNAIRRFQEKSEIAPTGEIDPRTLAALVAVHGS